MNPDEYELGLLAEVQIALLVGSVDCDTLGSPAPITNGVLVLFNGGQRMAVKVKYRT